MQTHSTPLLDIIGDVHGALPALERLLAQLGYDADWRHPDGRTLVFLGDLVDRGAHSLEIAERVMALVQRGEAVCLMGNHEYNLVRNRQGKMKVKHSNADTIADIERRPERWGPVLDFFARLPLAIELPDLRIVHAVWLSHCVDALSPALGLSSGPPSADPARSPVEWLLRHVAVASPIHGADLHPDVPTDLPEGQEDLRHELLIKGHERPIAASFADKDGAVRNRERVTWWHDTNEDVPTDKPVVFGHYWNLPPLPGHHDAFAPPYPSGTPALVAWLKALAPHLPPTGRAPVPEDARAICVDYNGALLATKTPCAGALRWPEREVVWAFSPA